MIFSCVVAVLCSCGTVLLISHTPTLRSVLLLLVYYQHLIEDKTPLNYVIHYLYSLVIPSVYSLYCLLCLDFRYRSTSRRMSYIG